MPLTRRISCTHPHMTNGLSFPHLLKKSRQEPHEQGNASTANLRLKNFSNKTQASSSPTCQHTPDLSVLLFRVDQQIEPFEVRSCVLPAAERNAGNQEPRRTAGIDGPGHPFRVLGGVDSAGDGRFERRLALFSSRMLRGSVVRKVTVKLLGIFYA